MNTPNPRLKPAALPQRIRAAHERTQQGISLIMVLLLLVIVSMLGVASMQIAMMGERGARNDRDLQVAWQGAEAALVDAEFDLQGTSPAYAGGRAALIEANPSIPSSGCTTEGTWRGICAAQTAGQTKPTWLLVDFTNTGGAAPSVAFGTFTGRSYANSGGAELGIQPAQAPRYVLEDVTTSDGANPGRMVGTGYTSAGAAGSDAATNRLYRVTAMGFGPRGDIQAVLQTIYRN